MNNRIMAVLFGIFTFAMAKMGIANQDIVPASEPQARENISPIVADSHDVDVMARTLWGEARNEGYKGMQAVANVIMNRTKSNRWPDTPADVCLQYKQFSAWNDNDPNLPLMRRVDESDKRFRMALEIARKAVKGDLADITGGADHYLNISFTRKIRGGSIPKWAELGTTTRKIGAHTFMRA